MDTLLAMKTLIIPFRLQFQTALTLPRASARGFTLVETLIVLATVAVLLAIGVPSMASTIKSVKLRSASDVFVSGLLLARSEAIKRNARTVLCKSADGSACALTGGWEQGWIVFPDINNNGARESAEDIILREAPLAEGVRVVGNPNVAKYVSFTPSGATKLVGGGFQAGRLTVCHQSAAPGEARQIILNAVGRPRVQKTRVADCA
jgi:type IV fimbrial biogenesis protein FimT